MPSSVVSDGRGASQSSTSPPHMTLMQQQINQYRLSQQRKTQEPEPQPEPEPNYFEVGCTKVPKVELAATFISVTSNSFWMKQIFMRPCRLFVDNHSALYLEMHKLINKSEFIRSVAFYHHQPLSCLYQDLTPAIEKKPQVVILERPEEEQQISNRLSFSIADPLLQVRLFLFLSFGE